MIIVATDRLPKNVNALTVWPFVFVRPARRGDAALIAHERLHGRRQRNSLVLPWLVLYLLWPYFRWREEILGYRAQIAAGGITRDAAAHAIVKHYWTGRSLSETYDALDT